MHLVVVGRDGRVKEAVALLADLLAAHRVGEHRAHDGADDGLDDAAVDGEDHRGARTVVADAARRRRDGGVRRRRVARGRLVRLDDARAHLLAHHLLGLLEAPTLLEAPLARERRDAEAALELACPVRLIHAEAVVCRPVHVGRRLAVAAVSVVLVAANVAHAVADPRLVAILARPPDLLGGIVEAVAVVKAARRVVADLVADAVAEAALAPPPVVLLPVAGGLVERVLRVEALVEGGAVRGATRLQLVVAQLQREGMFPVTERGLVLVPLAVRVDIIEVLEGLVGPAGRRAAGGAVQVGVPPGAVVEFLRAVDARARGVVAHVRAVRDTDAVREAFDLLVKRLFVVAFEAVVCGAVEVVAVVTHVAARVLADPPPAHLALARVAAEALASLAVAVARRAVRRVVIRPLEPALHDLLEDRAVLRRVVRNWFDAALAVALRLVARQPAVIAADVQLPALHAVAGVARNRLHFVVVGRTLRFARARRHTHEREGAAVAVAAFTAVLAVARLPGADEGAFARRPLEVGVLQVEAALGVLVARSVDPELCAVLLAVAVGVVHELGLVHFVT